MIEAGQVFASISDVDGGMVRFSDHPTAVATATLPGSGRASTGASAGTLDLAATLDQCAVLAERVAAKHQALASNADYLKKVGKRISAEHCSMSPIDISLYDPWFEEFARTLPQARPANQLKALCLMLLTAGLCIALVIDRWECRLGTSAATHLCSILNNGLVGALQYCLLQLKAAVIVQC
jgi:hypothetical protein